MWARQRLVTLQKLCPANVLSFIHISFASVLIFLQPRRWCWRRFHSRPTRHHPPFDSSVGGRLFLPDSVCWSWRRHRLTVKSMSDDYFACWTASFGEGRMMEYPTKREWVKLGGQLVIDQVKLEIPEREAATPQHAQAELLIIIDLDTWQSRFRFSQCFSDRYCNQTNLYIHKNVVQLLWWSNNNRWHWEG